MYKDKGKQREAVRKAVAKTRGITKGITEQGITSTKVGGITWYPNKKTDDKGKPITPVTLSDGQLFYPSIKFKKVKTTREPAGLVSALANPVRRKKIESITDNLKAHGVLEGVRYGIGGPTFKTINEVINSKP